MSGQPNPSYKLVRLACGAFSVHSLAAEETFHPGIGPVCEAEALYVRQLRLPQLALETRETFVIWDVGLGSAANALTAIRALGIAAATAQTVRGVELVSFDCTTDALQFALEQQAALPYVAGFETPLAELIRHRSTQVPLPGLQVNWTAWLEDFPALLHHWAAGARATDAPHAIFFDPHSPAKNPAMWTVGLFTDLFRCLDARRPCVLATYTRSTLARVALLLGGFFVGAGHPSGMKEETTVASNRIEQLEEPLDRRWLERARRSQSAEPLHEPRYRQAPLSDGTWERLNLHRQFQS